MTDPNPSPLQPEFYRALFESAPAQIVVEDFTDVGAVFSKMRDDGVQDFVAHAHANPELIRELMKRVRVRDANKSAITACGFANKAELITRFADVTAAPFPEIFSYQLASLWANRRLVEDEYSYVDAAGQSRASLMQSFAEERDGNIDLSKVVLLIRDITTAKSAVTARLEDQSAVGKILVRANILLWWATVRREAGRFRWKLNVPRQSLDSPLLHLATALDRGRLWDRAVVPEYDALDERANKALLSGAPGYDHEFRIVSEGKTTWLHEEVGIQRLGENDWSLVGVVADVTRRRQAEEAHQQSGAHLRQILTQADCLLWQARVTPRAGGGFDWSIFLPESVLCRKLFGPERSGRHGRLWVGVQMPDQADMDARSHDAIRTGKPGYEQVFRVIRNDELFWLHEQVSIAADGPGQWMLVGVITDITGRRQAEMALAAEKERLAVTLRAMAEGVITTDTRGVVQFMNRAAETLTGFRTGEAVGRPLAEVCTLLAANGESGLELSVVRVLADGVIVELPPHTVLSARSGAKHLVAGCCAPVRDASSTTIGAVLVFRDVTERQRLDEELLRASKLESVGLLAGGIAHDFNNILTAIMGNLALALLDANGAPLLEQSLREAQVATMRARDLTQQLLTFAKGGDPVRTAVQLPQIVTEVSRFALHGSRVGCDFDLPENLWSANADKGQLGQIVQNLVINATQAMPGGGVVRIVARNETVTADTSRALQPGDYVRISVIDSGTGIRPEHLEHIFDPYFTTKKQGHGLGLATVYSIVRKHGGHIEVESQLGGGSVFHVWLPALRAPFEPARVSTEEKATPLTGRVLFMDDEAPIRKMAAVLIARLGLEVELAADGAEAVQRFKAANAAGRPFDLVVMDLTVPGGMGGREALEVLRKLDSRVKAIVSSGYSSDPVLANFRSYGFRGMVAKPYQVDDFMRVLRDVLSDEPDA